MVKFDGKLEAKFELKVASVATILVLILIENSEGNPKIESWEKIIPKSLDIMERVAAMCVRWH